MFFRKDPPQAEGRRNADPRIKTAPDGSGSGISFTGSILLIVYVFVADASLGFAGEAHSAEA